MKVLALFVLAASIASGRKVGEIPAHYSSADGDQLMKLLIEKGFAKEKEDNIDKKCGCDCTCCQARHSQYWIDRKGARIAAKEYVGKNLHLSGQKLEDYLNVHFEDKWY